MQQAVLNTCKTIGTVAHEFAGHRSATYEPLHKYHKLIKLNNTAAIVVHLTYSHVQVIV